VGAFTREGGGGEKAARSRISGVTARDLELSPAVGKTMRHQKLKNDGRKALDEADPLFRRQGRGGGGSEESEGKTAGHGGISITNQTTGSAWRAVEHGLGQNGVGLLWLIVGP